MPRQSDPGEVLASFTLARDNGVRLGSVLRPQLDTQEQLEGSKAKPSPELRPALRVVGIVAAESEFPSAGGAALARHVRVYPSLTYLPAKPTVLVNFGESVNFPLLLAVALTVFGAATLLHLLLVSVARRRTEAGLLKALGFVRRQVAAAVCWQATVVAAIGIAVGVPAGVAAGRVLWRVFATNLGVLPVAVVEPVLIAVLAAGVLSAANLLAAVPALLAARSRPAQLLRAE